MRGPRQEDVVEPERDHGQRRARGDHGAAECGGILLQKIDGLRPVSHTFSQTHLKPLLPSLYFLHSLATGTLHILPRLIRRPEQSPP